MYTILQSGVPPTNPAFAGASFRFYWPFHVLIAAFTVTLDAAPPLVMLGFNLIAALGIILVVRDITAAVMDPPWQLTTIASTTPLLALHPLRPLLSQFVSPNIAAVQIPAFPTSVVDVRITTFLHKFLTSGGFSLGLLLVAVLLYLFIQLVHSRYARHDQGLFIMTAVLLFLIHATTALYCFLGLGVGSMMALYYRRKEEYLKRKVIYWTRIWGIIGVLSLPFFLYIQSVSTANGAVSLLPKHSSTLNMALSGFFNNIINFVLPYFVTALVVLVGMRVVRNQHERFSSVRLLSVVGVTILIAGSVTFLDDNNQYKAVYIVILPFAPTVAIGTKAIFDRISRSSWRVIITLLVVGMLVLTPLELLWLAYLDTPKAADDRYEFNGTDISYTESARFEPTVFEWLQRETLSNSTIIVSPQLYNRSEYDISGTEMIFSAVSQRRLYYGAQAVPSVYLQYPERNVRQSVRSRLTSCHTNKSVPARTLNGPLYLLIAKSDGAGCTLVTEFRKNGDWRRATNSSDIVVFRYRPN